MTRRIARPFAVVGFVAAVLGAVGAMAIRALDPVPQVPSTFGFGDAALIGFAVLGIAFASVGALLVVRRPGNVIGWFMVLIGDGYAVGIFWAAVTYWLAAYPSAVSWLDLRVAAWLTVLFTSLGGAVFALGFIFPTGRGHTPAWNRALKAAAIVTPFMFVTVFLVRPGPLHVFPTIDNPIGIGPDLRPWFGDQVSARISALAVFLFPFVVWSVVSRYRLAADLERRQLKWFGLAIAVAIASLAIAGFSATLSDDPPEIGLAMFGFAGALVPVAIGIAILRYRLYEIDRIISRSIAYAAITGILFGVFVVVNLTLQAWLSPILGSGGSVAVAASTLFVAALFNPLRGRVQRFVDRRFDRSRYDAEQTVAGLAAMLRDEVDLTVLGRAITDVVERSVAPTTTRLWLREAR